MNCAHEDDEEVSPLTEETGDSDMADVYIGNNEDDDDGKESCNGGGCDDCEEEDKVMTWAKWIAMARAELAKRGEAEEEVEEDYSPVVVDEEENRRFWETCLASGYP